MSQADLWEHSEELKKFFAALEAFGVREYVQFDPQIVRGWITIRALSSRAATVIRKAGRFCGGGHYDNLVSDVGGDPLPGVGFAMGDVMLSLVLQKYGLVPGHVALPGAVLVTVFDAERRMSALKLATELRGQGIRVVSYPEAIRLDKQLKYADKLGIRLAVIQGPAEEARGEGGGQEPATREQVTLRVRQRRRRSDKCLQKPYLCDRILTPWWL